MNLFSKIFKNPAHQQVFECDGVIKVPFLEADQLLRLREAWHTIQSARYFSPDDRYHVTLLSDNAAYKNEIARLLQPVFEDLQNNLLYDYRVITTNLIIKYAHSGEVPLHQNWTFVDEQQYASLTIWCPLQEVNEKNGALYFLKGSHRTFRDIYRGPQIPYFFIRYEHAIRHLLEPICLKAGEALIFDDSILHYSPANQTSLDRVAIQGNVVPKEADIYYHEYKKGWFRDRVSKIKIEREELLREADWEQIKSNSTEKTDLPFTRLDHKQFLKRLNSIHG